MEGSRWRTEHPGIAGQAQNHVAETRLQGHATDAGGGDFSNATWTGSLWPGPGWLVTPPEVTSLHDVPKETQVDLPTMRPHDTDLPDTGGSKALRRDRHLWTQPKLPTVTGVANGHT